MDSGPWLQSLRTLEILNQLAKRKNRQGINSVKWSSYLYKKDSFGER